MGTTPEAAMTTRILVKLERYRPAARFYKIKSAGRRGVPDVIGVVKGMFVAIEVKTPHGKTSPLQDYELELIRNAEGHACVARSPKDACDFVDRILRGG